MTASDRGGRTRGRADEDAAGAGARVSARLDAIGRLTRAAVREDARALRHPLTPAQVRTMEVLVDAARDDAAEGMTSSVLATRLGLARSTVSGILDRLERDGLIARRVDPKDRRATRVRIARPVRDWLSEDLPALRLRPLVDALETMTRPERLALLESLELLQARLESRPDAQRGR
jgi:MarR family transcriptional regulator, organic hydroperoxide resistance regulator